MKRALLIVLIGIAASLTCLAGGPGTPSLVQLKARVVESGTNEDLSGVKVSVPELGIEVYTDKAGFFELPMPVPSTATLQFSFVSYEPLTLQASSLSDGVVSLVSR